MRPLYRMHDAEPRGVFPVAVEESHQWNAKGCGIFWAVNTFDGPRRIENLVRIDAWAVDMDAGTKAEQHARISSSPLVPSLIVETKRGFQVYWCARDAKPEHWNAIVLARLVPYFGADKNARDLARILRVPGYKHLKNPAEPFLVREAWRHKVKYSELEIANAFPEHKDPVVEEKAREQVRTETRSTGDGDGFWERVWHLDCAEGLSRLSGHLAVNGEVFTFRRARGNGNRNILVNGKGTSCWVDANGRIGSLANGGPTLYAWLRWYGRSPRECAAVLKEIFPQLEVK